VLRLHFSLDRRDHHLQTGDTPVQELVLPAQVHAGVGSGIVEDGRDLFQRKAQLAVEQDLLQPLEVGVLVAAIPESLRPLGVSSPM
jgi:hypothetical protein